MITWITGNSKAGKTTLAFKMRTNEIILDGDVMRTIWTDLGFSKKDRCEQNMRVAKMAKELEKQGFNVIIATICPYKELRKKIKELTKCKFIYLSGGLESNDIYPYEKQ